MSIRNVLVRIPKGEGDWVILIVSSMSDTTAQPVSSEKVVMAGRPKGGGRFTGLDSMVRDGGVGAGKWSSCLLLLELALFLQ